MEKKDIIDFLHTRLDIGLCQYAVLCSATKVRTNITIEPEPLFTPESCINTTCKLTEEKIYKLLDIENMKNRFKIKAYSKNNIFWLHMESDNKQFTVGLTMGGSFVYDVLLHVEDKECGDVELLYAPELKGFYLKEDQRACDIKEELKNYILGNFYNNCYGLFSQIRKEKEKLKHNK